MVILYAIIGIIVVLIAVMALNTWVKKPARNAAVKPTQIDMDKDKFAHHLSGLIQHKTVSSYTKEGVDDEAFLGLHKYLSDAYPLVHKTLEREVINDYSLLYKWTGSGSDQKPMLMMAHMDVVPVEERTLGDWAYGPFSGEIAGGYIWGRGALDMKGQLCAIMEAVEHLLETGYVPKRDVYIALGHDEESLGIHGNGQIAKTLEERGVHLDFVIDEGGVVMDGKLLGVGAMVAAIGVTEKGYMDVRLTASSKGGHASRPPKETAVGAISKALVRLEKHQMKPTMNTAVSAMLDAVGGYMKFPLNVIAANKSFMKPLLLAGLAAKPTSAAMVRTTTAPTMLNGSKASNVLAEKAEAVINFRISPDNTIEDVIAHIKKVIKNDDIKVEIVQSSKPSPVSSVDSDAYLAIKKTVSELFGGYVVTPYLMIAMTDSRHYQAIADGVYLFQPFRSMTEDLGTIHAAGERLSIDSLVEGVAFFAQLVKNADG